MFRRRAIAAALAFFAGTAAAGAVTPYGFERHLRHRNHEPRLPHPEILRPDDEPPLSSGFVMTIAKPAQGAASLAGGDLNLPRDVAQRLAECWNPPAGDDNEITVRVQFSRDGKVIGQPRVTYVKSTARDALVDSLRAAFADCAPLRFTPSLGAAIAGYPFAIRFVAGGAKP